MASVMENLIQLPAPGAQSRSDFSGFEPYVDESVVASFINLTPRHVLELARAGQLPAHPIGRLRKNVALPAV